MKKLIYVLLLCMVTLDLQSKWGELSGNYSHTFYNESKGPVYVKIWKKNLGLGCANMQQSPLLWPYEKYTFYTGGCCMNAVNIVDGYTDYIDGTSVDWSRTDKGYDNFNLESTGSGMLCASSEYIIGNRRDEPKAFTLVAGKPQ